MIIKYFRSLLFLLFFISGSSCLDAEEVLKLIVIRHGEAWNNVKGVINSNPSHPNYISSYLTKKGKQQCCATARQLKKWGIGPNNVSTCFVSPLPRTQQTAFLLSKEGLFARDKIRFEPRIIEIQMGCREGMLHSDFPKREKHDHSNAQSYGGETDLDVRERMVTFLNKLKGIPNKGCVIIVSHGSPCAELHYILTGEKNEFVNAEARSYLMPL